MYKLCTACLCVCVCKDYYVIYTILLQVGIVAMSIARLTMAVKVIYMCGRFFFFFWVMTRVKFNILKQMSRQNNKVH